MAYGNSQKHLRCPSPKDQGGKRERQRDEREEKRREIYLELLFTMQRCSHKSSVNLMIFIIRGKIIRFFFFFVKETMLTFPYPPSEWTGQSTAVENYMVAVSVP